MNELVLICEIGDRQVAMSTDHIRSVIDVEHVTAIPGAPAHVLGLTALRSQALTIIDTRLALGLEPADKGGEKRAVVTDIDGHAYALLIDRADDVCASLSEPKPLPGGFGAGWQDVAIGVVETERGPSLLVDIKKLAAGLPALAA
ncbi:chemotaxis protein CheW [Erythrobacter sp. W53]|uniref:chemotaxis protein CheW n=1 Tax=Erythrobacter sp. W53 TaxID=3425947 RepID=UPI003D7691A4